MSSHSISSIYVAMIFPFDGARVRARTAIMGDDHKAFRMAAVKGW